MGGKAACVEHGVVLWGPGFSALVQFGMCIMAGDSPEGAEDEGGQRCGALREGQAAADCATDLL